MAVNWGSVGWWTVVLISVPFSGYASVFLIGDFDVYKKYTIAWLGGNYDTAGLHIFNHLRAWQVHVAAAYVFMLTAPFQFSGSAFRAKYPRLHRRSGYAFVVAAVVTAVSALAVLAPNTEFPSVSSKVVFVLAGISQLYCVFVGLRAARAKRFSIHRQFMIRTAALGYSVINTRIFPPILRHGFGVELYATFEYGLILSFVVNILLSELYIWSTPAELKVARKKVS